MKKLLSTALLSLGLALPAIAPAQEVSDEDITSYCQEYARLVEVFATFRDQGLSQKDMVKVMDRDPDQHLYQTKLEAIDLVYTYPKFPPREEGNRAYEICPGFFD